MDLLIFIIPHERFICINYWDLENIFDVILIYIGLYSLCLNVNHAIEYKKILIYRVSQKNLPLLDKNNSRRIWPTKSVHIFFEKLKHVATQLDKNNSKLGSHVKARGN